MDAEDSAVQDFLQILEEHRKNCERQVSDMVLHLACE